MLVWIVPFSSCAIQASSLSSGSGVYFDKVTVWLSTLQRKILLVGDVISEK